jgi:hypothetical protein
MSDTYTVQSDTPNVNVQINERPREAATPPQPSLPAATAADVSQYIAAHGFEPTHHGAEDKPKEAGSFWGGVEKGVSREVLGVLSAIPSFDITRNNPVGRFVRRWSRADEPAVGGAEELGVAAGEIAPWLIPGAWPAGALWRGAKAVRGVGRLGESLAELATRAYKTPRSAAIAEGALAGGTVGYLQEPVSGESRQARESGEGNTVLGRLAGATAGAATGGLIGRFSPVPKEWPLSAPFTQPVMAGSRNVPRTGDQIFQRSTPEGRPWWRSQDATTGEPRWQNPRGGTDAEREAAQDDFQAAWHRWASSHGYPTGGTDAEKRAWLDRVRRSGANPPRPPPQRPGTRGGLPAVPGDQEPWRWLYPGMERFPLPPNLSPEERQLFQDPQRMRYILNRMDAALSRRLIDPNAGIGDLFRLFGVRGAQGLDVTGRVLKAAFDRLVQLKYAPAAGAVASDLTGEVGRRERYG